jgi:long-chain acyl-CoA synthetase
VGIFSKNRAEWAVVDVACILYKLVSIPIYDTLGDENITYVLKHVSLKTLFVNDGAIKALQKTHDLASLKTLVSFDPIKADQIKYFE